MKSKRIIEALYFSSSVSLALFVARALTFGNTDYWYLNWNLLLAWVPLFISHRLAGHVGRKAWVSQKGILLTLVWLLFLPNSFYLASDFIHLQNSAASSLLFDVVLILSFTLNGFILGYLSVYSVHRLLLTRVRAAIAHRLIGVTFLLCSFAVYLGRYLRWNTWDVLINPAGLLFDVSDRFINPSAHEQTFRTTALFFVLIGTFYIVIWRVLDELQTATAKASQARAAKAVAKRSLTE